jgi:hypothetical protein
MCYDGVYVVAVGVAAGLALAHDPETEPRRG